MDGILLYRNACAFLMKKTSCLGQTSRSVYWQIKHQIPKFLGQKVNDRIIAPAQKIAASSSTSSAVPLISRLKSRFLKTEYCCSLSARKADWRNRLVFLRQYKLCAQLPEYLGGGCAASQAAGAEPSKRARSGCYISQLFRPAQLLRKRARASKQPTHAAQAAALSLNCRTAPT